MAAKPTQTVTQAGSFTLNPGPGETDFMLIIGPTAGATAYSGLTLKIEGTRGVSGLWVDIGTFTTDYAGPLTQPLSPADGSLICYQGDCRPFTQLRVTTITVSGYATMEFLTGSFFSSPPVRMIGAGGSVGVSGTLSIASDSRGSVGSDGARGISSFELTLDPEVRDRLDVLIAAVERIEEGMMSYLQNV